MTGAGLRHILSKNIKSLRSQRSISQIELAEKANISLSFLSNIERSNKWPYPETLAKIADALSVEVYMLFQDMKPALPENIHLTLDQFKNDMAVSLHKSVSIAIDNSIETIGSHYLGDKPEK